MRFRSSIFLILLLWSSLAAASNLTFYVIHPEGEGDSNAAKPYLSNLYDYLNQATKLNFSGLYLNDADDAETALKDKKVNLAIVSPEFYEKFHKKYDLNPVLKTIPIYSNGPYERYYIMAHQSTKVQNLMDEQTRVNLFSAKDYPEDFLNGKVFIGNDEIKKIPWKLQTSSDIVEAIKKVSAGEPNTFVLLTGHEFSVVNKLRRHQKDFEGLKLIYTSKELPSSSLVTIGKNNNPELGKIKAALIQMPSSLHGNLILKKLRLKGFAQ